MATSAVGVGRQEVMKVGGGGDKNNDYLLSLVYIHIATFLWGFTAILGKLISTEAFTLVWHRMTMTFLIYLLIPQSWRDFRTLDWKTIGIFFGIGLVVCLHWLFLYGSIKEGNSASIALSCLGTVSFFTAVLEPLILNTAFSTQDLISCFFVIVGVVFIYAALPQPPAGADYQTAVIWGTISALLASLFTILNKRYHESGSPLIMSTIEMGAGSIFLTVIVPLINGGKTKWFPEFNPNNLNFETMRTGPWDLIWMIILSGLCTNVTFYLSNVSLKDLSAFTINLVCNLEPCYGIILGAICFHENKSLNFYFYIGATIVILSAFLNPLFQLFGNNNNNNNCCNSRSKSINSSNSSNSSNITNSPNRTSSNSNSNLNPNYEMVALDNPDLDDILDDEDYNV